MLVELVGYEGVEARSPLAQLINFAKNDKYGYMFWLYDERTK